ncbi:MAG: MFS transporter [Erysipelotrichia bacterium]|nr:MFS transporter [Erysipelotrichia bacterium]
MGKVSIRRMMILVAMYNLTANLAHPTEPTFFQNLGMPDWMFGVAYACMALGSFLMSPLWGRLSERFGASRIMEIGLYGYALGQLLFMLSSESWMIICARLLAGFFTSNFVVGEILYIMENSEKEKQGRYLAEAATISAVMSAFGYMVGGLLGDVSVYVCFNVQWISLALIGVYARVFVKDHDSNQIRLDKHDLIRQSNPFRAFLDARSVMTAAFAMFLGVIALTMFASTAFDNCFNYFIKDQYGFPPSMNGWLKGAVALITLLANSTICVWLMKKTDIFKSVIPVLVICTAMTAAVCGIDAIVPFIILNVLFFGFSAVYKPLLQAMIGVFGDGHNRGIYVGVYNSMCAVGSVTGSLAAGFIYSSGPKLSFLFSAAAYGFAAILALLLYRERKYIEKTAMD